MKFNAKQLIRETGDDGDMPNILGIPPLTGTSNFGSGQSDPSIVHNQADYKASKVIATQDLDHIQSSVFSYLAGEFLDPRQALYNVKSKLNHLGLDFVFNKGVALNVGSNVFRMSRFGEKFGTTPTNNLMVGFDRGTDYTDVNLSFELSKGPSGNFTFRSIRLEQLGAAPMQPKMQAENFFQLMANDEYISENILKPIYTNLADKVENNTLTELDKSQRLTFIIERTAKELNINLTENDVNVLANGLGSMLFTK